MLHDDGLPLYTPSTPIEVDEEAVFTNTPFGSPAAILSKFKVNGDAVSSTPSPLLLTPLAVTSVILRMQNYLVAPKNFANPIQSLSSMGKLSLEKLADVAVYNVMLPDASVNVLLPE